MNTKWMLTILLMVLAVGTGLIAAKESHKLEPMLRTVDLNVGEKTSVELCNGKTVTVMLLAVKETRDELRNAVRHTEVRVSVNDKEITLTAAYYRLPVTVGDVQIDCAVTRGFVQSNNDRWGLHADARLRLWPAGSPWIRPGTFCYPVKQRWFASDTQMANVPVFVDGGEVPSNKSIYYHSGLDVGGMENMVEIVAATDAVVVSSGTDTGKSGKVPPPVKPRYDVVYLRDARGWYYRYSYLASIDRAVKMGAKVKQGQKIGMLGKEGASGGWTHLHFEIKAVQPSGQYGTVQAYAFFWQSYHTVHKTKLQAVARPHHLAWIGQAVRLDGTRSWSAAGAEHITRYEWTFSDGSAVSGPTTELRYSQPGTYSEILKITDDKGRVDYDFAVVQVVSRDKPDLVPPTIHAVYWPTFDIKAGDEVAFAVRSFRLSRNEGRETWDFGDGSPLACVQSDGNANAHAKDGYAITRHRYDHPGHYIVTVSRTNHRGETAIAHLHVRVGSH